MTRRLYVEPVIEMGEAATAVAVRELAAEKQVAVDRAVDATADQARGRPLPEVEALLRAELLRRGVEPDEETRALAAQIAAAVDLRV